MCMAGLGEKCKTPRGPKHHHDHVFYKYTFVFYYYIQLSHLHVKRCKCEGCNEKPLKYRWTFILWMKWHGVFMNKLQGICCLIGYSSSWREFWNHEVLNNALDIPIILTGKWQYSLLVNCLALTLYVNSSSIFGHRFITEVG